MPLIIKCNNGIVTDNYLRIIGAALSRKYNDIRYSANIHDAYLEKKSEVIVVARTVDAFRLLIRGYRNVYVWFQGVEPEESYMVHHSRFRYVILSSMEKMILRKASFFFFVSREMLYHYENKYGVSIPRDCYYCMPCMNTQIHKEAFECEEKYKTNYFAYIGSLAVWQGFEETVKVYKQIEDSGLENCRLFVFTSQTDEAQNILCEYGVKNYSVDFVNNQELPNALKTVKYGFILRENTTVNRVATPTKISTYLSCGLIPIYSSCLKDFAAQASHMSYAIEYDANIITRIKKISNEEIHNQEVFNEYEKLFDTYYSRDRHVNNIDRLIKNA